MLDNSNSSLIPAVCREFVLAFLVALFAGLPFAAAQAEESASASSAPLWGALDKGPYDVGYRVLYAFDASRTWAGGKAGTPDLSGRPVRISIWYPSASTNVQPMRVVNYVHHTGAPAGFAEADAALESRDRRVLAEMVPASGLDSVMTAKMRAVAEAPAAQGRFPLLIYSGGINATTLSNVVMAEYLASHGYVVATVPSLGISAEVPEQSDTPAALETSVRDLEFAYGVVRRMPDVNDKFGVFGHSLGGTEAMILGMRNSNVDAIAGLDGTYGFQDGVQSLTGYFGYAPDQLRAPILDLRRADAAIKLDAVDAMSHADRYLIRMDGMNRTDFTTFAPVADMLHLPGPAHPVAGWTRDGSTKGYRETAGIVLDFFDMSLNGRPSADFGGKVHQATGRTVTAEAATRTPS